MKKVFLFIAASALTVSLNSCSKDDVSATVTSMSDAPTSTLSFKMDGTAKTFTSVNGNADPDTGISIIAAKGMGEMATFTTTGYDKTGTAIYDKKSFKYIAGELNYDDTNLTFNVTENSSKNKTLKGTFSGTLQDGNGASHNVTEGTFNINY